jgi:hypothetical protein
MNELTIETTDPTFLNDIRTLNKLGFIEIYEPMSMAKPLNKSISTIVITVNIFTSAAGGFFAKWLYDRYKKPSSGTTTINEIHITNNITVKELNIIIENKNNTKQNVKTKKR